MYVCVGIEGRVSLFVLSMLMLQRKEGVADSHHNSAAGDIQSPFLRSSLHFSDLLFLSLSSASLFASCFPNISVSVRLGVPLSIALLFFFFFSLNPCIAAPPPLFSLLLFQSLCGVLSLTALYFAV